MRRRKNRARNGSRVKSLVPLIALTALWAVPVVAVGVAVPLAGDREQASVAPPLPSVVTVGSQSTDYRTSVSVSVDFEPAQQVRAPTSGLLTSLAQAGEPLTSGQELFAVDGLPVLAQPGTVPLHRELRAGDEGEDVEVLGRFLLESGFLEEEPADDSFGPGMRAAVVQLQERLGVEADGIFAPSYVAYVPESAHTLGEPLAEVARTVSAGETVFRTAPVAERVRFSATSTDASLAALGDVPLALHFGDVQIPVSSIDPAPEEVAAIDEYLRQAVTDGTAQIVGGDSDGPGDSVTYTGGLLSLADEEIKGVVPGSALHITSDGAQCLFREGSNGTWVPILVVEMEPALGTLGSLYVDPDFIDARIARDPLTLADHVLAECG